VASAAAPRAAAPPSAPPAELSEAELTLATEDHTSTIALGAAAKKSSVPAPAPAEVEPPAGSIFQDLGIAPPPGLAATGDRSTSDDDIDLDDDAFDPALAPPPGYRSPD